MTTTRRPLPPKEAYPGPSSNGRKPKAKGDRWQQYNTMVDTAMQHLALSEQAVLNCLFRDARNGVASASQTDIARRTNQSVRQVRRAIRKLLEIGALQLVKRGNSFQSCSSYKVFPDPSNWGHGVRSTPDI